MNRRERQSAILGLVRDRALSTQAELVQALRDEGHDVVQTTVSRDVTELGLVKVRAPSGRLIYAAPGTGDADRLRAIGAAIRRYATGVEAASGGLVVVSTPSGYASALAQAIDEGSPSLDRRDARRRQHHLHRGEGRDHGARAAGGARALPDDGVARDDALVGPRRRLARSRRVGLPPRRGRRAPPLRLRGERPARPRLHGAGFLTDGRAGRGRGAPRRDRARPGRLPRRRRGRALRDRAAARRASAARSTPAGRATTRSRRRSASTCSTPARRRGGDRRARARRALVRRGRGGHAAARLHAPPARSAGHARPPPARLGRDARPRPRALRGRRSGGGGEPARRRRARRLDARPARPPGQMRNSIDAVADRDFALDYLYAAAVLYTHLSRIGEEIVLWSTAEFGFVGCRRAPPRARR